MVWLNKYVKEKLDRQIRATMKLLKNWKINDSSSKLNRYKKENEAFVCLYITKKAKTLKIKNNKMIFDLLIWSLV